MPEQIPIGRIMLDFHLKERLVRELQGLGLRRGSTWVTKSADSVDYPDFAHPVAALVEHGEAKRGIPDLWDRNRDGHRSERHRGGPRRRRFGTPDLARLPASKRLNVLFCRPAFLSEDDGVAILRDPGSTTPF
jgi:ribose 5-phosphate isomerase B